MDSETVLDQLFSNDILVQKDGDLALTNSFRQEVDRNQDLVEEDLSTSQSEFKKYINNENIANQSEYICSHNITPVAEFLALREQLDITEESCARLVPVIDQFLRGTPKSAGTPESFFSIRGDLIHLLIPSIQQGIIYFWRHDCEPCDLVKTDFEDYFEATPSDMALLSVYGPNWTEDAKEYDVRVAPTILFLRNGQIDTRLVGALPAKALTNEIRKIKN
jgi:hypothetical protein